MKKIKNRTLITGNLEVHGMEKKQLWGVVILILAAIFLVGTIFEVLVFRDNEKQHEENKETPFYEDSDEAKDNEDTIETQKMFAGICGTCFVVFLVAGLLLFILGNKAPQPGYQQSPPGYQPPYQAPPSYPPPQQPPNQPPNQPPPY